MDWFFPSLFAAPVEAQASLMDDLASATTTPSSSAVPPSPLIPPDPLEAQRTVTDILRHYSQPCGAPPPWSRYARPYEKQRVWVPPTVRNLWWYVAFFATKGVEVTKDIAAHHVWGPRKKSWGIEMTMLYSFMRNLAEYTHLTDPSLLRTVMSLGGWIPVPSDALITPVTYRAKRRGLKGILAKYDAAQDGTRELSGEWVVGKRLWQRLQAEWKHSTDDKKSPEAKVRRKRDKDRRVKERVILYLCGGAYYTGGAHTHRTLTIPLSKATDCRVFVANYRLAPDTRFPGPLHDVTLAYFRLIEELNIPPTNIVLAGDSAGGGLTVALLMYLRDYGYPLPSAAILMCPWVDLTMSCESWDSNADVDVITFPRDPTDHMNPVVCYLGEEGMKTYLTHPYASPLFGDFTGLPPMLIQNGDSEVIRDEGTLLAHKASMAGVEVSHEMYEDAVHVFQLYPFLEQSRRAFQSCGHWIHDTLPKLRVGESPQLLATSAEAVLDKEIGSERLSVVAGDGVEIATGKLAGRELAEESSGSGSEEEVEKGETGASRLSRNNSWMRTKDSDELGLRLDFGDASTSGTVRVVGEADQRVDSPPLDEELFEPPSSPYSLSNVSQAFTSFMFAPIELARQFSFGSPATPPVPPPTPPVDSRPRPQSIDIASVRSSRRPLPKSDPNSPSPSSSVRRKNPQLTMTPVVNASPPVPMVRSRSNTGTCQVHPNMVDLCKSWSEQGPANRTTTFRPEEVGGD